MASPSIKVQSSTRQNPLTTYPNNCVIPCQDVLHGRYRLQHLMLPVTYFNVSATNNKVYFSDTTGAHVATLTPGYYNAFSSLATEVATQMTSAGNGTVTCAVSSSTNLLTVSNTENFSFTFGTHIANSAAVLMGFIGNSAADATSQVAVRTMNLSELLYINFSISEAASDGVRSTDGHSYTFSVPAAATVPNLYLYEPSEQNPVILNLNSTRSLTVRIYDDHGNLLNNMYSDWSMLLKPVC